MEITLPEGVWRFLGRAWFFIAGVTMGVLFALALVAIFAHPAPAAPRATLSVAS